jgi:putative intracellular protease/amidase
MKILFIVTSHSFINTTDNPTGLWLEELAVPYYIFCEAGYDVDIVSIAGGKVPIDPKSLNKIGDNSPSVDRFLKDDKAMAKITNSHAIDSANTNIYDGIFLPGGHGTMWDLPENLNLASIVSDALIDNRIVAAVCHGPAGLLSAKFANGESVVKGRRVSAFTNEEEEAVGLTKEVPFLLETRLHDLGAIIEKAPNFQPFAVVDGNLITGQNPASSEKVARLVIDSLNY